MNKPKLRFGGFEERWEEKKLGEMFEIRMCKRIFKDQTTAVGEVPFYKIGTIGSTPDSYISQNLFKEYKSKYNFPKKGEVMITCSGTVGKTFIYNGEDAYYQDSNIVRLENKDNFGANKFIFYIISKLDWSKLNSTTITRIYNDDLRKLKIFLPSISEQQKIADFLTAVDEKINNLSESLENRKNYKKGMMQKIFSQEIRFKDKNGNNFPDWQEKKLGDIGFFKTSSIDKNIIEGEELVKMINYMNVYRHENINNNTKNLMIVSAKQNQIEGNNLKKGDILFTPSSEIPDDIGHSIVIFEDLENTVYSYHLLRFRPNIQLNLKYSHYFCNIPEVLDQFSKFSTGSTRFTLSLESFGKVVVKIPSIEEQEKISDFLCQINEKIENIEKELETVKTWKKGLLQNLFV